MNQNQLKLGGDRYDPNRSRKSLHGISTIYKQTKLDPSFQRLGGVFNGSGWSYNDSCEYLDSLLDGSVENKLILAKVDSCLVHSHNVGCKRSIEYFEEVKKEGYSYVSIDGNNSSSTIYAFTEDVPVGKKKIKGKNQYKDVFLRSKYLKQAYPSSDGYWAKLDPDMRLDLQASEKLDVTIYGKILVDEMCEKFRNLNKSTHLNSQEHRQARRSNLAAFIRQTAREAREPFLRLSYKNENFLDERKPDEEIACFALKVESGFTKNLAKSDLDLLYEQEDLSSRTKKVISQIMKDYMKISDSLSTPLSTKLGKGKTQSLFEMLRIAYASGYAIKNYQSFFNWFLKKDIELIQSSKDVTEKELEEKSYTHWCGRYTRKAFYCKISDVLRICFESAVFELEKEGIIARTRDPKEVFSHDQKMELLTLQNWKTRNGLEISPLDFYTGKLHADHMMSVRDGGSTSIPNGEMMPALENLKKGSDTWVPHFPHQMIQESLKIKLDIE